MNVCGMCTLFYENRVGIKKSVINLFTCFVRIPARNSANPIIQITRFPTMLMKFHEGGISSMSFRCLVWCTLINSHRSQCNNMYKNTISNFRNFSFRLRNFSSNFMKNTYFFALGRGPYMGPKYVGTKILADFGSAIMWSSILHQGSKASGCTETDKEQNMSSWAAFFTECRYYPISFSIYLSGYRTGPSASKITKNILVLGSSAVR